MALPLLKLLNLDSLSSVHASSRDRITEEWFASSGDPLLINVSIHSVCTCRGTVKNRTIRVVDVGDAGLRIRLECSRRLSQHTGRRRLKRHTWHRSLLEPF